MSSVTSTQASAVFQPPRPPTPKANLSQTIAADVSAGSISATDGTALSSALDSIDASLKSGQSSGTSSTRLDPSQMKDKVDGLIDDQVSSGSLTSDQASTLKSLFAANGAHHGGSAGHAKPADADGDDDGTIAASATAASTSATTDTGALLDSFLKVLQSSQATASGYAASGTAGSASKSAPSNALLFDFSS